MFDIDATGISGQKKEAEMTCSQKPGVYKVV